MWLQQLSTFPNRFPCFLLGCQFQFPNFTLVWILYHWFVTYHHHHHNLWHLFKVEPNVFQTQFPFSILLWTFFVCFSAHLPVPYISSHLLCELTNFFLDLLDLPILNTWRGGNAQLILNLVFGLKNYETVFFRWIYKAKFYSPLSRTAPSLTKRCPETWIFLCLFTKFEKSLGQLN